MENPINLMNKPARRMILLLMLFSSLHVLQSHEQTNVRASRHLEITYYKTTSIVFSSAIKNVDRGSRDILAQKAKGVENILQLKAGRTDFPETNLTVITADGGLHHFIVSYASQPDKLIIDIDLQSRTNYPDSEVLFSSPVTKTSLERYSNDILAKKGKSSLVKKRRHKMTLALKDIYVQDNTIFYLLSIKNRSNIDYDIGSLRFHIRDRKQMKRTASQEVEVTPVYVLGKTDKPVKGPSEIDLVYALEKFTIPDARLLIIELFEKNGGRHLDLSVKNRMIVKAKSVPGIQSNADHI